MTFGIESDADVRARDVEPRGLEGTTATVRTPAGEFRLRSPLLGLGNLSNVLAGVAVAVIFDVPLASIADRVASLRPAYQRGELLRLPGGLTLIDDSYNSSPAALKRSLETLAAATGSARKIAILGEMLELGDHAAALHEASGRAAAAAGLDLLIVVGHDAARVMAGAAIRAGMAAQRGHPRRRRDAGVRGGAAADAPRRSRAGEGVARHRLDAVVERLKAEFA